MHRFREWSALTLLCFCLSACAANPVGEAAREPAGATTVATKQTLLPVPSGPLDLSGQNGADVTLEELLARLSKVTNVTFSASDSVGVLLKNNKVALSQNGPVAVTQIYPWAESILQQNGFSLALLEGGSAPLVGVYSIKSGPNQNPPALNIEADRIDECRAHPAFQFSVVMTLPNTDVRALGNSLRILSPDSQTGGVIPVGTTRSVILSGSGRQVAELAAMLRTVDEAAAKPAEMPPNQASPAARN